MSEKSDKDYEALNQRLLAAIVTLTGAFMLVGIILYLLLGR